MWLEFQNPGASWRGKPLWSWNGKLEKAELRKQLHVLRDMGFGGFFIHVRSGLATEYLGEEWFELVHYVTDEADKLGLETWLYDEDRWPSGSAGGKVTEDPRYRRRDLWLTESDSPAPAEQCIARFAVRLEDGELLSYRSLTGELEAGERAACFDIREMPSSNIYNGNTYIDTMSREAVDRFIQVTHEAYWQHCGSKMGRSKSIKGIFTDEPDRGFMMSNRTEKDGVMTCASAWTEDLPQEFAARKGYDFLACLPEIFYRKKGEILSKPTRDYFDVADDLFLERFAMNINNWCEAHDFILTGHSLHEDSLTNQSCPQGSLMRFYEYEGCPGMDQLDRDNKCYWIGTQLLSACRQLGKTRLLSELYGVSGWDFDLKEHKIVGDWQTLMGGINLRCPHLCWYTMEGECKRDYPASLLHQSPWYKDYRRVEDYFARFGYLMAQGKPDCDVLVVSPIESVWGMAHAGWANWIYAADPRVKKLEKIYTDTFHAIADAGIDFDYGEEQMMERMASVSGNILTVGLMKYRVAVVSGALDLRENTKKLLADLMAGGGHVVFAGEVPETLKDLAEHENTLRCRVEDLGCILRGLTRECAVLTGKREKPIFLKSRFLEDGSTLVALLNLDSENAVSDLKLTVAGRFAWAERLDCETGRRILEKGRFGEENAQIDLTLLPAESRIYRLSLEKPEAEAAPEMMDKVWEKEITGDMDYTLHEDNVCVLDRCRYRWEGGEWSRMQDVLRWDNAIRDSLSIERRSGEMMQTWFAEKYDNPEFGQLEVEYEFTVDALPEEMTLAAERPDCCAYFINDTLLSCPDAGDTWVDMCFKKLPIPMEAVKPGKNRITMKTAFKRTSNLEAVYLLGRFGVEVDGVNVTVTTLPGKIHPGDLTGQKLPFYTGPLTYHVPVSGHASRVCLQTGFTGASVRVDTGMDEPQTIKWDPWQADITRAAQAEILIPVTFMPTRRDTFGPLHVNPVRFGSCGPNHFVLTDERWTDEYALLENGIHTLHIAGYEPRG